MDFSKIKLRDGMFVNMEYREPVGTTNDSLSRECNNPIHEDFKDKFKNLRVHALLITELADPQKVKGDVDNYEHPILEKITVKGVSITNGEGVTISFERKLSTGKVLPINTPYTKYYEDNNGYRFGDDLQLAISELVDEAEAYIVNKKFGEGTQLTIDIKNGEDEDSPL